MAATLLRRTPADVDILRCSICTNLYSDPRALPCLHTFCFKCIDETCKDKQPGETAECPLCRQGFVIPESGISNLQKNAFISNLLNIDELKRLQSKLKLCDICMDFNDAKLQSEKTAKVFCSDCQQSLCKSCCVFHTKLKSTSSHKLVYLNEKSDDVNIYKHQSLLCNIHVDKQTEAYCFDCKITLCMMCYIKDHSSHKCSDLVEAVGEFCSDLKQDVHDMNAAIGKLDENIYVIQLRKTSFLDTVKEVEFAIFEKAETLKTLIETEKLKLLAELSDIKINHEKELDNLTQEMTQDKTLLKNYKKYCTELLQKGTTADITREASGLRSKSEELVNVKNVEDALKNLRIGNVSFLPSNGTNGIVGQVVKQGPKPGIPTTAQTLPGSYPVTGLALLDEDLFVHRWYDPHISVFNSVSLQLTRQISISGFKTRTWGIAACSTNKYLYVSDYQQHCIHRVGIAVADANLADTRWNVHQEPAGISVNCNCNVLVAYQQLKKVQEYTPNGYLVREVSDGINTLWQALELNNDTLVVYRTGPAHGIATMTTDGRVLRCYGNQPAGGAVNVPAATRTFAIDSEGNIIVANQDKNAILVINSSLTDAYSLQLPDDIGLQSPCALCYDQSRGLLYVADCGGKNLLLVFSNVTNISSMFNK